MSERELNAYEKWCVHSNLRRIEEEGLDGAEVVALLRANGYPRVAAAVKQAIPQTHRVEVRFDIHSTGSALDAEISKATKALCDAGFSPEVTEVLDQEWNEA